MPLYINSNHFILFCAMRVNACHQRNLTETINYSRHLGPSTGVLYKRPLNTFRDPEIPAGILLKK